MKENQLKILSSVLLTFILFLLFQNFTTFDFAHDIKEQQNKKEAYQHFNEVIKNQKKFKAKNEENDYHERDIVQIVYQQLRGPFKKYTQEISDVVIKESYKYKMDPLFTLAIIKTESRFNPEIIGSAGEIGLMQIKPKTAEYMVQKFKITGYKGAHSSKVPFINIKIGLAYFNYLRTRFNKQSYSYITAYNTGPLSFKRSISSEDYSNDYYDRVVMNYVDMYRRTQKTMKLEKLVTVLEFLNSSLYIAKE